MAAEESNVEEVLVLTVRVSMLSGYVCSVDVASECTVQDLKRKLKIALSISMREITLLVDVRELGVRETLASAFGVAEGPVDVTLVRILATCWRCGTQGRVWHCQGCHTATYCSTVCQRADWRNHRRTCRCIMDA